MHLLLCWKPWLPGSWHLNCSSLCVWDPGQAPSPLWEVSPSERAVLDHY